MTFTSDMIFTFLLFEASFQGLEIDLIGPCNILNIRTAMVTFEMYSMTDY